MRNTENKGVCVFRTLGGMYIAKNIMQALLECVKNRNFDYGDVPAESVLEFLWLSYFKIQRADNDEIKQGFCALDRFFEGKSFEEVKYVFDILCNLCLAYEKRAFTDGLHLGAQLMEELQA